LDVEVRQQNVQQGLRTGPPVGVDAVLAQPDGQAFKREYDRGVIVAKLVHQAAVGDALAVIEDAVINLFAAKMSFDEFAEFGKEIAERGRLRAHQAAQLLRQRPDGLMLLGQKVSSAHKKKNNPVPPTGFEPVLPP